MNSHDRRRDNRRAGDQWNSCSLKQNLITTACPISSFYFLHLPVFVGDVKTRKERPNSTRKTWIVSDTASFCQQTRAAMRSPNRDDSVQSHICILSLSPLLQVDKVAPIRAALVEGSPCWPRLPDSITQAVGSSPHPLRGHAAPVRGERRLYQHANVHFNMMNTSVTNPQIM